MKYLFPLLLLMGCSCAHTAQLANDDFYHYQVGEARFSTDPTQEIEPYICLRMDGMLTCISLSEYLAAVAATQKSTRQEL